MDKRFAIFDMDGTLIDSMRYWEGLAAEYLHSKGVVQISPAILERIAPMTMTESAALFIREYGLSGTPKTVAGEMNAMIEDHYRRDIPLKPGVMEYLDGLRRREVLMCVASATAEDLMAACLTRLGAVQYFQFLLSCEEVGAGKSRPDVYLEAAKRLGAPPEEIAVYEDALYAANTAKRAGFYTIAVYDDSARCYREELTELTDEVISDWQVSAEVL